MEGVVFICMKQNIPSTFLFAGTKGVPKVMKEICGGGCTEMGGRKVVCTAVWQAYVVAIQYIRKIRDRTS